MTNQSDFHKSLAHRNGRGSRPDVTAVFGADYVPGTTLAEQRAIARTKTVCLDFDQFRRFAHIRLGDEVE